MITGDSITAIAATAATPKQTADREIDLRDAINAELIEGPHMQVSGPALSISGGHCDNNLLPFDAHVQEGGVADAHRLGRKVAAHAHGSPGILWATQAGVDSMKGVSAVAKAAARKAIAAHVKVALGTDAADLMGWSDKVGTLGPGKWADIIALKGDPLQDVKLLQNVSFVKTPGKLYKSETP